MGAFSFGVNLAIPSTNDTQIVSRFLRLLICVATECGTCEKRASRS